MNASELHECDLKLDKLTIASVDYADEVTTSLYLIGRWVNRLY